jgi:hypothetical protein
MVRVLKRRGDIPVLLGHKIYYTSRTKLYKCVSLLCDKTQEPDVNSEIFKIFEYFSALFSFLSVTFMFPIKSNIKLVINTRMGAQRNVMSGNVISNSSIQLIGEFLWLHFGLHNNRNFLGQLNTYRLLSEYSYYAVSQS